jgi:hypothetical protein
MGFVLAGKILKVEVASLTLLFWLTTYEQYQALVNSQSAFLRALRFGEGNDSLHVDFLKYE